MTLVAITSATATAPAAIRIHPDDDVAIVVQAQHGGEVITVADAGAVTTITLRTDIPAGHKVALRDVLAGSVIHKYGVPIGRTTADIAAGDWVHSHNLETRLSGQQRYEWHPAPQGTAQWTDDAPMPTFDGYRRRDGRVGTRNEVWIINTVGCVNTAAERIAREASARYAGIVDGVHAFAHPYGCSQLGDDLHNTQRVLAGMLRHPNAGGVLVLGLGCENNQMDSLLAQAGDIDPERLRYFNTQDVGDEVEAGVEAVGELVTRMLKDRREPCPVSSLILGHKCGGSDGFSGITANPLLGRIADRVTAYGGGVILTEVPEMFGAEQALMDRAASESVFNALVAMINDFKAYFARHQQPVFENPSPGNKQGGITTLEEKSLGAIQKGGRARVERVLRYGQPASSGGLSLLEAPGNDGVSSTAMVASGATLLLFTTGRGTPLGFPVPTLKVSSNTDIATRKPRWIDFNAGALLDGTRSMDELTDALMTLILDVASGRVLANNEQHGYREIAIWKTGVTL